MTARNGHHIDRFLTQFVGKLAQILTWKLTQIGRVVDAIEKRVFAGQAHKKSHRG
jgi:hypothetical protein